jgi:hypothetical protein
VLIALYVIVGLLILFGDELGLLGVPDTTPLRRRSACAGRRPPRRLRAPPPAHLAADVAQRRHDATRGDS